MTQKDNLRSVTKIWKGAIAHPLSYMHQRLCNKNKINIRIKKKQKKNITNNNSSWQLTWVKVTAKPNYVEKLPVCNNHKKHPYKKLPPLWVTKIWQSTQVPYQTLWWMHTMLNHTKSNPVQLKLSANPKELPWISKATLFHEHPCSCTRQRAYCTLGWYWPILIWVPR